MFSFLILTAKANEAKRILKCNYVYNIIYMYIYLYRKINQTLEENSLKFLKNCIQFCLFFPPKVKINPVKIACLHYNGLSLRTLLRLILLDHHIYHVTMPPPRYLQSTNEIGTSTYILVHRTIIASLRLAA